MGDRSSSRLLAVALLISVLLIGWSLWPQLWDKYRVVRDTQNFYWMARAQDLALFSTDYLTIASEKTTAFNIFGFHLLVYWLSPGYGLLFYLLSILVDYVWLAKLSVFVSGPVCVFFLFKLGRFLQDRWTGLSLSLIGLFFILASPLALSIIGGLQRSFVAPILIIFLYCLVRRQYAWAALMILIAALVYLPIFPPMVLTYLLTAIRFKRPFVSVSRRWLVPLAISLSLSGVVVTLALMARFQLFPGSSPAPVFGSTALTSISKFQSEGSAPLFISFPWLGRAGIFDKGADVVHFLVLLIVAILVYRLVGVSSVRRMSPVLWRFLAASMMMYAVSLFFLLELNSVVLYLPSRYTRSSLLLTLLFFVGLNWPVFIRELPGWLIKNGRLVIFFFVVLGAALGVVYTAAAPVVWLVGLMMGAILVLIGGSLIFWVARSPLTLSRLAMLAGLGAMVVSMSTVYIRILGDDTINPTPAERAVYEFVATLPKDAMLAGDPAVLTGIPLFSRRSVLFRDLFPKSTAPIIEYYTAQYAETPETVRAFCRQYQVDYLVIDLREFRPDYLARQDFFHQPWNDEIVKRVAGRTDFVLPNVPPLFESGPLRVIPCKGE